jgi:hypothetical protein
MRDCTQQRSVHERHYVKAHKQLHDWTPSVTDCGQVIDEATGKHMTDTRHASCSTFLLLSDFLLRWVV